MFHRNVKIDFERRNSPIKHYSKYNKEADVFFNSAIEAMKEYADLYEVRPGVYKVVLKKEGVLSGVFA